MLVAVSRAWVEKRNMWRRMVCGGVWCGMQRCERHSFHRLRCEKQSVFKVEQHHNKWFHLMRFLRFGYISLLWLFISYKFNQNYISSGHLKRFFYNDFKSPLIKAGKTTMKVNMKLSEAQIYFIQLLLKYSGYLKRRCSENISFIFLQMLIYTVDRKNILHKFLVSRVHNASMI